MSRRRRRRRIGFWLPWIVAALLVGSVTLLVRRASLATADDLVARAIEVRRGDPLNGLPTDPRSSLEILRAVLDQHPDHFEALMQSAQAYADLTDHASAVAALDHASRVASTDMQGIRARRAAVGYLTTAGRHDEAVAKSAEIVELQPNNLAHQLSLGLAQYNGSTATQAALLRRFVGGEKTDADLEIEQLVESYVTDLWGEPDPDALLDELAPDADPTLRLTLREELTAARRRFLEASQTLAGYRDYAAFDQRLAEGYCEILLRSGRLFEAHLEASMALRHPKMPKAAERHFLEVLAAVEDAVGEHGLAADRYEDIALQFLKTRPVAPPRYIDWMLEQRVKGEQWELLLEELPRYRTWTRATEMLDWAEAASLAALGDHDGARDAIRDPATIVSLGARLPPSLRAFPERRRAILLLAHELYAEVGDNRGLVALDALLAERPDDLPARRLRIEQLLAAGLVDAARDDAYALLTVNSRDIDDFALWLDISNRLNQAHYGNDLQERAKRIVAGDLATRAAYLEAQFKRSQVDRQLGRSEVSAPVGVTGLQNNPALAYEVIQARLAEGDLVQARVECRQLSESHPQVQMFRFLLARLLVREGQFEPASVEFRELLKAVPSDGEALELAMRVELALGRHEAAGTLVNEMILADPRGVGAVRYGLRLLDEGRPEAASRLVERLLSEHDHRPGLDVWLLAARAFLARGDIEAATNILVPLATTHPDSDDVALLGLELGLAADIEGLVEAAADRLVFLTPGLFPNQLERLTSSLLEAERPELLLQLFDETTRAQPSVRSALRPLAAAAKALGHVDEASDLLARVEDEASVRDRFLLLSLDGRGDEASHRLRLSVHQTERRNELELCDMVGQALRGQRALGDAVPIARLRDLGVDVEFGARRMELFDALLRLLPVIDNLEDVLPRKVLGAPEETYPTAGEDIAAWIKLARKQPARAKQLGHSLLLMVLAADRPFWATESRFLARYALETLPSLITPTITLARRTLDAGAPDEALAVLVPLLDARPDDVELLELALRAGQALDRDAWGLALVAHAEPTPAVRRLLADALRERGLYDSADEIYVELLAKDPADKQALSGRLDLLSRTRHQAEVGRLVRTILEEHPLDDALRGECLDALAHLTQLVGDTLELADELAAAHPEHLPLQATVARAASDDPERLAALLDGLLEQLEANPISPVDPRARERSLVLRQAAIIAQRAGFNEAFDRTRRLYEHALLLQPGAIEHFRELAYLDLEQGNLISARRFLEVLTFVEPSEKKAVLSLARLLFEQIGQPHQAAAFVQGAYQNNMPPEAVEVLAADAYLSGRGEDALTYFQRVAKSPLLTEDTYLTVGRIAYAAGLDESAAKVFDLFLLRAPDDHPARARVEAMRDLCAPPDEAEQT
ncbi:MAG: hypothetical protein DHS20C15_00750 [Planctomycetota bacterium]|nr:MAG: hypothetical protein DHS20C15_00750 [Planctomycetota bacterium]